MLEADRNELKKMLHACRRSREFEAAFGNIMLQGKTPSKKKYRSIGA